MLMLISKNDAQYLSHRVEVDKYKQEFQELLESNVTADRQLELKFDEMFSWSSFTCELSALDFLAPREFAYPYPLDEDVIC
jgi:hypothetical protein